MRIISDFKDYYDCGMQYGSDPQLPYRRFREVVPVSSEIRNRNINPLHLTYVYVGFAGKVWTCIPASSTSMAMLTSKRLPLVLQGHSHTFRYDLNSFDDGFYQRYFEAGYRKKFRQDIHAHHIKQYKKSVAEAFCFDNEMHLLTELFEKHKTAIFVYIRGDKNVILNERLNLLDFQKILPPMEAYQELSMYVGSYLTKPTIEEPLMPDKIRAEIKGFDKFSFRKEKQKMKGKVK